MLLLSLYKFFRRLTIFICFFFYLYPVQFEYVPVSTRILLSIAGLVVLIFSITKQASKSKDIFISRNLVRYVLPFASIIFVSGFSIVLNNSNDIEFIKYPLSLVFILLAGYFVHFIIKKVHNTITYKIVISYIIAAVLVQIIISVIAFVSPAVNDALQSIQNISDLDISKLEETTGLRLNGFGSTFFGAGIINGFALLSIAALVKQKNNSRSKTIYLSFAFVVILALGSMMSRTTLVGGILAILFLFIPAKKINKKIVKIKLRFFGYILLIPVLIIITVSTLFPRFTQDLETAAAFGFELFVNYYETGSFSTASTEATENMYVFPDNAKTYIIGDGHYYIKPGDPSAGYYKSTDVGYLRLIYYFGIIGTIIYFTLQYTAVINALKSNPDDKTFRFYVLFIFFFCLITSLKGFTDLFFFVNLFAFNNYKIENAETETSVALSPV